MILQYIFSMAISTHLFATLLLFCDTVFPFALHVSARLTLWHCFDMGVESRDGGVYNRPGHASLEVTSSARDQITTDPGTFIEQRHAGGSFPFIH